MKKGRFLWSAHRITKKQKAGKARNIKEKQLKNSRNTASKPPVALRSSASADPFFGLVTICSKTPEPYGSGVFTLRWKIRPAVCVVQAGKVAHIFCRNSGKFYTSAGARPPSGRPAGKKPAFFCALG
ncbi:MAG: hypothetical protein DBX91_06565 [Subdoligranulum variabile]|nr:MAG: hypothetical protein DBX91_06565 [Subdoligranulum variabile]